MGIKTGNCSDAQLLDRYINSSYDKVANVSDNMPSVVTVSNNIDDVNTTADAANSGLLDNLQEFNNIYYGGFVSEAALELLYSGNRPDGNPRQNGDLYYNTTADAMFVWSVSTWTTLTSYSTTREIQTITSPTNTIYFSDIAYTVGAENLTVYLNGVLQVHSPADAPNTRDYEEINGSTIQFNELLEVGDELTAFTGNILGNVEINVNTIIDSYTGADVVANVLTLDTSYATGQNNIYVYVNGIFQASGINYTESSTTTITFDTALDTSDTITVITGIIANNNTTSISSRTQIFNIVNDTTNSVTVDAGNEYIPGSNHIQMFINGVKQIYGEAYIENADRRTLTLTDGVYFESGDIVEVVVGVVITNYPQPITFTKQEVQTATAGQTTFTLTNSFSSGANNLSVYVNGVKMLPTDYTEDSNSQITFSSGLNLGDKVQFIVGEVFDGTQSAAATSYTPAGTGAVTTNVQAKLRESVSVKDFGATGDGVTDDSAAILAAFDSIRTTGGEIDFPNSGGTTYLVSYGFLVPSNCTVRLNGCKIRATTTWGQGTIPTNGTIRSQFSIYGSLTGGAAMTADVQDVSIIGEGAEIDMRYSEQTGSPPGSSGIGIATTPAPIVGNLWKTHHILVRDIKLSNIMWYGLYVEGAADVLIENVDCYKPANLGFVVISGKRVTFNNCVASYAQERVVNQGSGYWNEPNETWQSMTDIVYNSCRAFRNSKSGFRIWNSGQDTETRIQLNGCHSSENNWDSGTEDFAATLTAEAAFVINQATGGAADFFVELNNCIAYNQPGSGFKFVRSATGTINQRMLWNSCLAVWCGHNGGTGVSSATRAPFHVSGAAESPVNIETPTIIDKSTMVAGYSIALESPQGIVINDPRYIKAIGNSDANINITGSPATRLTNGIPNFAFDPAYDGRAGIDGGNTKYNKPIRFAQFDQTAEPASTDQYNCEMVVWQDDNNQFHGRYLSDDALVRYFDLRPKKRLRAISAYAGGSISAGSPASSTATVTGAALGDIVQLSYNQDLQGGGAGPFLHGNVTAADTVRWTIGSTNSTAVTVPAGNVIINVIGSGY